MPHEHTLLAEYFEHRADSARKPEERASFQEIAQKYRSLASELANIVSGNGHSRPQDGKTL